MKTISVRKSKEFSTNSTIYVHVGSKKIHIKGFGSFQIPIEPGDHLFATHLWTSSNKVSYENINPATSLLILPRLGKILAFNILIVFIACALIFIFFKSRWSFFPLIPFVIYVILYLTILKNRYLIIRDESKES
jgi:hypothetical protein